MRTLKDSKGKVIGVSMNDEPKFRRLKTAEVLTTHTLESVLAERRRAAEAAEAEAAKAKPQAETKDGAK